jgi:hypothetical protein
VIVLFRPDVFNPGHPELNAEYAEDMARPTTYCAGKPTRTARPSGVVEQVCGGDYPEPAYAAQAGVSNDRAMATVDFVYSPGRAVEQADRDFALATARTAAYAALGSL